MTAAQVRRVVDGPDVVTVKAIVEDYSDWVRSVLMRDFGISVDDQVGAQALFSDLATVLKPPGRLYLATLDGEPVGTAGLKQIDAGVGEIKRMYVLPSARGHGVGRMLMERLMSDAGTDGYSTLRLETMNWMTDAVALYRRFGFRETPAYGAREFEDVRVVDAVAVFMERQIRPVAPHSATDPSA